MQRPLMPVLRPNDPGGVIAATTFPLLFITCCRVYSRPKLIFRFQWPLHIKAQAMLLSVIMEFFIRPAEVYASRTVRSGNASSPGATMNPCAAAKSRNAATVAARSLRIGSQISHQKASSSVEGKTSGSSVQRAFRVAERIYRMALISFP
jgi:hypothetical protein